ncbi:MAG: DUF3307 domain-containing protein [Methanosarcinaceae archaeon]|nr:DUF3307 domain-containing protein [Methanosarcinaceae archaeon]
MIFQLLILQFIAHLLSDFHFQPQRWCNTKDTNVLTRYHFYHLIIVFITSYVLSFDPSFWKAAVILTLIHFFIDILKSYILVNTRFKNLFFYDQVLHLVTIAGITWLYYYHHGITFLFDLEIRTLSIVAGFILCSKPANVTIKFILMAFSIETPADDKKNGEKSLPNAGKLIGISERFFALALILLGQYEAVGLIIAAKSILRFNSTQKSEYVLIGTLLSFGIASFSGILINLIK